MLLFSYIKMTFSFATIVTQKTLNKIFHMFALLNNSCFNMQIEKIQNDSHNCYKNFSIPNYGADVPWGQWLSEIL